MVRALYAAASGMLVQQARLDLMANDLANAQTVGYQPDEALVRTLPEFPLMRVHDGYPTAATPVVAPSLPAVAFGLGAPVPVGPLGTGAGLAGVVTRWIPGALRATGNPLDVALRGPGFFVVETPAGPRFTRAGQLRLSPEGWLVTADGFRVLGAGPDGQPDGGIQVVGRQVVIDETGRVLVDGQVAGRLAVVDFPNRDALTKEGATRWQAPAEAGPAIPVPAEVSAGFLEMPPVQPVLVLVRLIEAQRAYEAGQRVIQVSDQTLGLAVNDVGRLRG